MSELVYYLKIYKNNITYDELSSDIIYFAYLNIFEDKTRVREFKEYFKEKYGIYISSKFSVMNKKLYIDVSVKNKYGFHFRYPISIFLNKINLVCGKKEAK